jgi:hypothetical protein
VEERGDTKGKKAKDGISWTFLGKSWGEGKSWKRLGRRVGKGKYLGWTGSSFLGVFLESQTDIWKYGIKQRKSKEIN